MSLGVIGIMRPPPLAPELDRTALIGYPVSAAAARHRGAGADLHCAWPTRPDIAAVARRSCHCHRRSRRRRRMCRCGRPDHAALTPPGPTPRSRSGAVPGLGAWRCLVGGVGIADVMVIAVLERRWRDRAAVQGLMPGRLQRVAARQFTLVEAGLLGCGGVAGAVLSAGSRTTAPRGGPACWDAVVPSGRCTAGPRRASPCW